MNYSNGIKMGLGDKVKWMYSSTPYDIGIIVGLIDEDQSIDDHDWSFLKDQGGGVMVYFNNCGYVQIARDDEYPDIEPI